MRLSKKIQQRFPVIFLLIMLPAFAVLLVHARQRPVLAVLGDSYSTFAGYITPDSMETWYYPTAQAGRTDVCRVNQTWWWQVARRGGYGLGVNNSWSGSTICNTGYDDRDATHKSFLTRMDNLGDPDVILIFGGTNDAWAKVPLGAYRFDAFRMADKFYFRPALAFMLDYMLERYKNARILFVSNCDLDPAYTASILTVCARYRVQVVQLHDIEKISGHPSVRGMRAIADQVLEALNTSNGEKPMKK